MKPEKAHSRGLREFCIRHDADPASVTVTDTLKAGWTSDFKSSFSYRPAKWLNVHVYASDSCHALELALEQKAIWEQGYKAGAEENANAE